MICEVYVTAISLGCQYNAPDIYFYVWWYLQLSQVDICCRGVTFYLSLIPSSAVPLGPSDTRVPFESHYNRIAQTTVCEENKGFSWEA